MKKKNKKRKKINKNGKISAKYKNLKVLKKKTMFAKKERKKVKFF